MEYLFLIKKSYQNPRAFPFAYLSTQLNEKCLNISPVKIGCNWTGKNLFKGALVFPLHV